MEIQRILFTFFLLIQSTIGFSQENSHPFLYQGVVYQVFRDSKTAMVIKPIQINGQTPEYKGHIVIPEKVRIWKESETWAADYIVTAISADAFNNDVTTSLVIPGTVNEIPYQCFYHCTNLKEVTINYGIQKIGTEAFSSSIEKVTFNSYVTSLTNGKKKCIISDKAFYLNTKLKSITIGSGAVSSIGKQAFSNCSSLTSFAIPNGITNINEGTFEYCSSLQSVSIPESVTTIAEKAFAHCKTMVSVNIPRSVTNISLDAFTDCIGLSSVSINCSSVDKWFQKLESIQEVYFGENVTNIVSGAFQDCVGLTSITIPENVISIDGPAFLDCKNLTSVTINSATIASQDYSTMFSFRYMFGLQVQEYILGEKAKAIGDYAFYGCSELASLTMANNVTKIGKSAFYDCKNLTSINISNSVTSIGERAFDGCSNLTSISIPNSVISIDRWAFADCSSLTSINIPYNLNNIGESVFLGCNGLLSIIVSKGNTKYDSRNECNAIIETSTNTLILGCKNTVIPKTVTSIGPAAFYYCDISSIAIPEGVTSISTSAFAGCSSIVSIAIPESCTSIGDGAFWGCSGLTSITIPKGVTNINSSAFAYCSNLKSVTIEGCTSIGDGAFHHCSNISNVYCYAKQVLSAIWPFSNASSATLHVPASVIEDYRNTVPWSSFGAIVALTDEEVGIEQIGNGLSTMDKGADAWFTLDGRQLSGKPATKGFFIRNGKKVLIK